MSGGGGAPEHALSLPVPDSALAVTSQWSVMPPQLSLKRAPDGDDDEGCDPGVNMLPAGADSEAGSSADEPLKLGARRRADRATSSESSDSGIATPGGSCGASDVASLEPGSPLSSCSAVSDGGETRRPPPPLALMPPSQPAAAQWPRPGRSRSQGDEGAEHAAALTSAPLSPPRHQDEQERPPAKRRRRASSGERAPRAPPPPPPPPPPAAGRPRVQEKITEYFSKQIKHISAQAFRSMKKELNAVKHERSLLQLRAELGDDPVPLADCDAREAGERDTALLRALKKRNGFHAPRAADAAPAAAAAAPSPRATDSATACRAPSETSSVDSGLGKERAASEPSTPVEASTPDTAGAPPVLRFPARRPADGGALSCCRWRDCGDRLSSPTQLLDHLQACHVQAQRDDGGRSMRCLWQGCKVFDRPGSAAWLERHVLSHGGSSKPFRCIVTGCSQRFASQSMLERHVNHHFNPPAPVKRADSCVKTARRSGRRAQVEQHPYSARIFDFCDSSAMERLRYQLVSADSALDRLPPIASRSIQLTAQVTARRTLTTNKPELLVHWEPADVVEDEWIPAHQFRSTRQVPCSQLPAGAWQQLALAVGRPAGRRRRKPS